MKFESQPEHSGNSFLRKKFKDLPIFFPIDYKNSNAVGTVVRIKELSKIQYIYTSRIFTVNLICVVLIQRAYKLHIGQRIFMTFKDQRGR